MYPFGNGPRYYLKRYSWPRRERNYDDEDSPTTKYELPISIFLDRKVAVLEAISEYLKERFELNYHEIAILLNRNERTIWTCYNRAKKKREQEQGTRIYKSAELYLPCEIFKDRQLSVLEIISEYLKEKKKLTYHEIAVMTNRDDRTIWTCYSRAKKKRKLVVEGGGEK